MMDKAEAFLLNGDTDRGSELLMQVSLFGEDFKIKAQSLLSQYSDGILLDEQLNEIAELDAGSTVDIPESNPLNIWSVLIVDPDTTVQHFLSRYLNSMGVNNIEVVADGTQAWEILQNEKLPSIIIMEWKIPGLDGPWLLQRMADKKLTQIPIIPPYS